MDLTKTSDSPLGLRPDAYQYLRLGARPSEGTRAHRPPLGIYNISISRVLDAMREQLALLLGVVRSGRIPTAGDNLDWVDPILKAHVEVLHAVQAHVDDCETILKGALCEKNPWNSAPGRRFRTLTTEYRERVDGIVNHIKHGYGRVRPFAFYTPAECFLGYYVEGVDREGAVGPEPTVHKRGRGAFSFARDVRLHFVWLYGLSWALAEGLSAAGATACSEGGDPGDDSRYSRMAEEIEKVAPVFYPDELAQPVPKVHVEREKNRVSLHVGYVDDATARSVPRSHQMRIAIRWQGDGISRSYRLPYPFREGRGNSGVLRKRS